MFFYGFTVTLCISLRSTKSSRYQSLTLESTLCLISPSGWSPVPPDLYSTQEGPLLDPLSSLWKGVLASPLRLIGTPVQCGYPCTPRSCLPLEGFSPSPSTPRFKGVPATSILPISFLCVFCVIYSVETLCETIRQSQGFINDLLSP